MSSDDEGSVIILGSKPTTPLKRPLASSLDNDKHQARKSRRLVYTPSSSDSDEGFAILSKFNIGKASRAQQPVSGQSEQDDSNGAASEDPVSEEPVIVSSNEDSDQFQAREEHLGDDQGLVERPSVGSQPIRVHGTLSDISTTGSESEDDHLLDAHADQPPSNAYVRIPTASLPASAFHGNRRSGFGLTSEGDAVDELLALYPPISSDSDQHVALSLHNFEIYRPNDDKRHASTLTSLNELLSYPGDDLYLFDGFLGYGSESYYVENCRFKLLSIDGYRSGSFEPHGIYIQSDMNEQATSRGDSEIWYRLETPAARYKRYHDPFIWLAVFAIHFEGYLSAHDDVCLRDFERHFFTWLRQKHGHLDAFDKWHAVYRKCEDFRHIVVANLEFLWKEATSISNETRPRTLWKETDHKQLDAIPQQPIKISQTVVTPFVWTCFQHLYFGKMLRRESANNAVVKAVQQRADSLGLSVVPNSADEPQERHWTNIYKPSNVCPGDIVVLDSVDGVWQDAHHVWYAYVQNIAKDRHGPYYELIWLYRPAETIIADAFYPSANELFFSDHCNCDMDKVRKGDIRGTLPIKMFAKQPDANVGAFIRQMYITPDDEGGKDANFVTLSREHLRCMHKPDPEVVGTVSERHFPTQSTVLVKTGSVTTRDLLEPAVVLQHVSKNKIKVRHLERRNRLDRDAKANELLDTFSTSVVHAADLERKCHVRRMTTTKARHHASGPYAYSGTGDYWLLTGSLSSNAGGEDRIEAVDLDQPATFIEGFHPHPPARSRMNGLSLFSGGGSFDRGLEEGSALQTKWAVEIQTVPLHTYRANMTDQNTELYLGSVNDYLAKAFAGSQSRKIAGVGDVQFISAGSPCKGFSMANQDRSTDKSAGYASLVASVVAFINLYLPEYACLENVFDMCKGLGTTKQENVFCHVVGCLVGMGYQVQTFLSDAWTYGSSQSRSRLLVNIAAPGLKPAKAPVQTHIHPSRIKSRAIGKTKSNVKFGMREHTFCSFPNTTAAQLVADLPLIDRGLVRTNIAYPDHRTLARETYHRALIADNIPRFPFRSGWRSATVEGVMPKGALDLFPGRKHSEWHSHKSKAFRRIVPTDLFPTIRTTVGPDDCRMGECLHWDENRAITVMEARRAQSIPDHEVLIGTVGQQWAVVGNGVDRKASVAMGVSLAQAWYSKETQANIRARIGGDAVPTAAMVDDMASVSMDDGYRQEQEDSTPSQKDRGSSPSSIFDIGHVIDLTSEAEELGSPTSSSSPAPQNGEEAQASSSSANKDLGMHWQTLADNHAAKLAILQLQDDDSE